MQETIIIPAAGLARRMKSYGPKALIELGGSQNVITRQLTILRKFMPDNKIIVVVGFEADKITKTLQRFSNIDFVYNNLYETTNVAYSIALALEQVKGSSLIIYGDLVFNEEVIKTIPVGQSCVVMDSKNQIRNTEVGLIHLKNEVLHFSYALPTKWAQIMLLNQETSRAFKEHAKDKKKKSYFGYEILNILIDRGYDLIPIESPDSKIAEIDTSKDIDTARAIIL